MHRHEAGRCRPSRTRTTALRSYHPPPSRGRTGREEERRRKNYMVKRGRCARKRPLDGTWTSQDGKRRMADRNEDFNWYRGPRQPLESVFLLSFLSFFSFFSLPLFNIRLRLFENDLPRPCTIRHFRRNYLPT